MRINIKLNYAADAVIADDIVPCSDDDLKLFFMSDDYVLDSLMVSIKHETDKFPKKHILTANDTLDITDHYKPGELFITVSLLRKGQAVKVWTCPPLIIKEVSGNMELFNGYLDLKKRVEALEEKTRVIM